MKLVFSVFPQDAHVTDSHEGLCSHPSHIRPMKKFQAGILSPLRTSRCLPSFRNTCWEMPATWWRLWRRSMLDIPVSSHSLRKWQISLWELQHVEGTPKTHWFHQSTHWIFKISWTQHKSKCEKLNSSFVMRTIRMVTKIFEQEYQWSIVSIEREWIAVGLS